MWGLVLRALGFAALLTGCAAAEHGAVVDSMEATPGNVRLGPVKEERIEEPQVPVPAPPPPPQEVAAAQEQVAEAAPAPPPAAVVEPLSPFMFDILFDFDRYHLREDARDLVEVNAGRLKSKDGWQLLLEGRGDERGTADYNLVLGERRAQSVKSYLEALGLDAALIRTISYGKDRPVCTEHSEACWAKNRSVHFSLAIEDRFYRQAQ
ncbi:OmpA family protein [Nitrospira sp. Kam-Ns4a]